MLMALLEQKQVLFLLGIRDSKMPKLLKKYKHAKAFYGLVELDSGERVELRSDQDRDKDSWLTLSGSIKNTIYREVDAEFDLTKVSDSELLSEVNRRKLGIKEDTNGSYKL